ncbi:MAG: hypothetical protein JO356_09135, partial [Acidobacteria bacterium]|nr:hypothetical protein [Acidobacteriota bacterium]
MMTEDRLEQDRERASLLQELLETPVGRRWLLKAGLCSAAATAAANLPAWSAPSRVLAQAARGAGGGPATGITLQFALGPAFAGVGVQPTPSASPSASSTAEAALTPSSRPTRVARATPRAPDTPEATASAETSGTPGPADAGPQAADRLVFGAIMAAATGTPAAATATPTAKPSTPTSTPTAAATPTDTPAATATTSTTPTATATPSPSGTGTPTVSGTPSAGGISNLVLIANGGQLPLIAHTAESRAALKAQGGLWAVMDLEALTHYVTDVPLSDNRGMLVSVQATRNGAQVLVAQLWHTPPAATRGLAQLAASGPALRTLVGGDQRLRALGLSAADVAAPEHVVQLESIGDAHATAVAMCGLHPQVATVDPTSVAATKALLGQTPEVQTLGQTISTMQQQGQDIATHVQAMNRDGSPARIKVGPSASDIVGTTFTTIQLNQSNGFQAALKSGVAAGIVGVRNSADLGQVVDKPLEAYPKGTQFKTWVQPLGVTPQAKPYTPPTSAAGGVQATLKVAYVPDQVPVSNGLVFGTGTQLTGNYSNGQVQLRIYNNWVRWVWAYVQYLGKDGTNLSADPGASLPNT